MSLPARLGFALVALSPVPTHASCRPRNATNLQKGLPMRKNPWHSVKQSIHHVCSNCNTGNNIERENLREGTGGKPLCKECHDLIARGGC